MTIGFLSVHHADRQHCRTSSGSQKRIKKQRTPKTHNLFPPQLTNDTVQCQQHSAKYNKDTQCIFNRQFQPFKSSQSPARFFPIHFLFQTPPTGIIAQWAVPPCLQTVNPPFILPSPHFPNFIQFPISPYTCCPPQCSPLPFPPSRPFPTGFQLAAASYHHWRRPLPVAAKHHLPHCETHGSQIVFLNPFQITQRMSLADQILLVYGPSAQIFTSISRFWHTLVVENRPTMCT